MTRAFFVPPSIGFFFALAAAAGCSEARRDPNAGAGGAGGSTGCAAAGASTCATGQVCERLAPATCADPNWANWPMPNGPTDVAVGAPNPQSYADNGDGTVTDKVTGLIWQQDAAAETFTQPQALAYCPTLNLAGHQDWRLPTVIELVSIVDHSRSNPSIDAAFSATPSSVFWSSSLADRTPPAAGLPPSGWGVGFSTGATFAYVTSTMYNVRCVR